MFYATFHPRGFANEFTVVAFEKKQDRDAWVVTDHDAQKGPFEKTRKQVAAMLADPNNTWSEHPQYVADGNVYRKIAFDGADQARYWISNAVIQRTLPQGASTTPIGI